MELRSLQDHTLSSLLTYGSAGVSVGHTPSGVHPGVSFGSGYLVAVAVAVELKYGVGVGHCGDG